MIAGLDIGGANTKCVILDEKTDFKLVYYPLWKKDNCKKFVELLKSFGEFKSVCTVTTAEICDTFKTKEEGIKFVENAVKKAFPKAVHLFLNCNGEIKEAMNPPQEFAASNWVASIKYLMEKGERDFLFVDIGSTTTDIIPVKDKILSGKSDFERLRRGELLYLGVLRTPIFYVLRYSKKVHAPTVPEFYSTVGDVFIITGDIDKEKYSCETPDGRGKTYDECCQRIARQFCCDKNEINCEEIAFEVKEEFLKLIKNAVEWQIKKWNLDKVIVCGLGDFVLKEITKDLGIKCKMLRDEIGEFSYVFPSYACAMLAKMRYKKWR